MPESWHGYSWKEIEYIKANAGDMSVAEIAKVLGRTESAIRREAARIGVSVQRNFNMPICPMCALPRTHLTTSGICAVCASRRTLESNKADTEYLYQKLNKTQAAYYDEMRHTNMLNRKALPKPPHRPMSSDKHMHMKYYKQLEKYELEVLSRERARERKHKEQLNKLLNQ